MVKISLDYDSSCNKILPAVITSFNKILPAVIGFKIFLDCDHSLKYDSTNCYRLRSPWTMISAAKDLPALIAVNVSLDYDISRNRTLPVGIGEGLLGL